MPASISTPTGASRSNATPRSGSGEPSWTNFATPTRRRRSRRRSNELATVVRDLASSLGHEPSPDEIAATLGIPTDHYLDLVARIRPVVVLGFGDLGPPGINGLGDRTRHWIDPDASDPVANTRLRQLGTRLGQAVERLTPRQRMVVVFHYVEDMVFREIAEFLGVTEGRISQLHTASMARLKGLLADQGTV